MNKSESGPDAKSIAEEIILHGRANPSDEYCVPFQHSNNFCWITQDRWETWMVEIRKGWPTTNTGTVTCQDEKEIKGPNIFAKPKFRQAKPSG